VESDLAIVLLIGMLLGIGVMLPAVVMARRDEPEPAKEPDFDSEYWWCNGRPPE
jgi:hypothetical protein